MDHVGSTVFAGVLADALHLLGQSVLGPAQSAPLATPSVAELA